MATPTPVEEWTLAQFNITDYERGIQVHDPLPYGLIVSIKNMELPETVSAILKPEQARALATMLLYAAEQVDPSGD